MNSVRTKAQVSAGGVAYRQRKQTIEVVFIDKAHDMLTFKSERNIVGKAKTMIGA